MSIKIKKNSHKNIEIKPDHFLIFNIFSFNFRKPNKKDLFLLEFIGGLKSNISYYKKMYQEVNLQVSSILRRNYSFYFIMLLRLFYFPLLVRRNILLTESFDKNSNY